MSKKGRPSPMKMTDPIPPGATREALDRPTDPGGGPPGSGGGERHALGDPGGGNMGDDVAENPGHDPALAESGDNQDDIAYSGPSGGAVGGTPAQGRSSGGKIGRGITPGASHRGDSTVGADPSRSDD